MKNTFLSSIAWAIAFSLISVSVRADFLQENFEGRQLIFDTQTGFKWLRLTQSDSLSVNDVVNGVGNDLYLDYQYATRTQFYELIDNVYAQDGEDPVKFREFIRLIGPTQDEYNGCQRTLSSTGFIDPFADDMSLTDTATIRSYGSCTGVSSYGADIYPDNRDLDTSSQSFANYLILRSSIISIDLPEGVIQECFDTGGSTVRVNAIYNLSSNDALDSIDWALDGNYAASGESVDIFVPLGAQKIEVTLNTILGHSATNSTDVEIQDTISPVLNTAFFNSKTGAEVSAIKGKDTATPSYTVSDVCDPSPTVVSATVGVPEENVDTVGAKVSKKDSSVNVSIQGNVGSIELAVTAEDSSGNISNSKAVLTITQ